jgi:hypothetical protein
MEALLTAAAKWLAGDAVLVRTRRMLLLVLVLSVASLAYSCAFARDISSVLVKAVPPPPLPRDQGDHVRFGVPLATRKQVFTELATAEPVSRAEGTRAFPGDELAWSADDHRGAYERQKVASIMGHRALSMTQVYLILDEGIRERWPGPDGKPLTPTTTPLHPRRKYGW